MINIPENDYVVPTNVNEEVVEAICLAFLSGKSDYHPAHEGWYRYKTDYVIKLEDGRCFFKNKSAEPSKNEKRYLITGAEMSAAFRVMTSKGYHMFRIYRYGTWKGYVCSKTVLRQ